MDPFLGMTRGEQSTSGNPSIEISRWDLNFKVADDPGVGAFRSTLRRVSFSIEKTAWNQLLRSGGGDLGRDYQHRERLRKDDDSIDTPAHFLRILSMAFPRASSSTSLSR